MFFCCSFTSLVSTRVLASSRGPAPASAQRQPERPDSRAVPPAPRRVYQYPPLPHALPVAASKVSPLCAISWNGGMPSRSSRSQGSAPSSIDRDFCRAGRSRRRAPCTAARKLNRRAEKLQVFVAFFGSTFRKLVLRKAHPITHALLSTQYAGSRCPLSNSSCLEPALVTTRITPCSGIFSRVVSSPRRILPSCYEISLT